MLNKTKVIKSSRNTQYNIVFFLNDNLINNLMVFFSVCSQEDTYYIYSEAIIIHL